MGPFTSTEEKEDNRRTDEKISFSSLGIGAPEVRVLEIECAKFSAMMYDNEQLLARSDSGQATLIDPRESTDRLTKTGASRCAIFHEGGYGIVAFRGTDPSNVSDIMADMGSGTSLLSDEFPFVTDDKNLRVHSGFLKATKVFYERVSAEVKKNGDPFFVTGHSLGSAIAFLFSYLYGCETGSFLPTITFGQPRVVYDDPNYSPYGVEDIFPDYHRYTNTGDVITRLPFRADLGGYAADLVSVLSLATRGIAAALSVVGYNVAGFVHVGASSVLFGDENTTLIIGGVPYVDTTGKGYVNLPGGADVEASTSTSHFPGAMIREHSMDTYKKRLEDIGGGTTFDDVVYIEEVDLSRYRVDPIDPKAPTDAHQHASDIHHGHHKKKHYVVRDDPRVLGYILYDPSEEADILNHAVLFEC